MRRNVDLNGTIAMGTVFLYTHYVYCTYSYDMLIIKVQAVALDKHFDPHFGLPDFQI